MRIVAEDDNASDCDSLSSGSEYSLNEDANEDVSVKVKQSSLHCLHVLVPILSFCCPCR